MRTASWRTRAGNALIVVAAIVWLVTALYAGNRPGILDDVNRAMPALLVCGLLLRSMRRGRDVDEAYRLGFDLGYERGQRDRHGEPHAA